MKKIINAPEDYTDDMLRGIYAAHADQVKDTANDLRCYCTADKKPGKVAIVTGGGTGHLPLFLGYVGENMLDGCGVGSVFQSPSAEQIYNISKEVEAGSGILYLYGNYTGDIMNFDMAAEMCEMDDIQTRSIVGADDVNSNRDPKLRRGIAGIFFLYKCAGAKAAEGGTPRSATRTSPWRTTKWRWGSGFTGSRASGTARSKRPTGSPRSPSRPFSATCPWPRGKKCAS